MKKYSQKNWYMLVLACTLGVIYAGYSIYSSQGGISSTGSVAFGVVVLMVLVLLLVVNKFYRIR